MLVQFLMPVVCHGEGTTAEVVTQNKEIRHTRLPLPPRKSGRHVSRVIKRKRKGTWGQRKRRRKRRGRANFFYAIHEFFVPTDVPTNVFVAAELPARYELLLLRRLLFLILFFPPRLITLLFLRPILLILLFRALFLLLLLLVLVQSSYVL